MGAAVCNAPDSGGNCDKVCLGGSVGAAVCNAPDSGGNCGKVCLGCSAGAAVCNGFGMLDRSAKGDRELEASPVLFAGCTGA